MSRIILAGRMHAVNREFVYIDFDDERFLPAKMVASAYSMVASACSTVGLAKMRPQFRQKVPDHCIFTAFQSFTEF